VILTALSYKDPLPPILSMHAGAGFITANHFALANSLTDRLCFCLRCSACAFHDRYSSACAQTQTKYLFANLK
jgi:hypothetical protein